MKALSEALSRNYEEIKQRNHRYSLRAFANKLNISSGALTELLKNKRTLSPKKARQIASQLELDQRLKRRIDLEIARMESAISIPDTHDLYSDFPEDKYEVLLQWQHQACLAVLGEKTMGLEELNELMGLSDKRFDEIIGNLVTIEAIYIQDGKIHVNDNFNKDFRFTKSKFKNSVNLFDRHMENLDLAHKFIETEEYFKGHLGDVTFAFDPAHIEQANKLLSKYMCSFPNYPEFERKKTIKPYRLQFQMFPLS